jgi:hypothetical protein
MTHFLLFLLDCFSQSSTLSIEAVHSSEILVYFYWTAWRYIPEHRNLQKGEDYCFLICSNMQSGTYLPSFIGTCCLHLQDTFPENGGTTYLSKVGKYPTTQHSIPKIVIPTVTAMKTSNLIDQMNLYYLLGCGTMW